MSGEAPLSELFSEIELPVRLYQRAEKIYHHLIQTYPDLIDTNLSGILYEELVQSLREELRPYAFDLCLFIVEVLKDHPELIADEEDPTAIADHDPLE